MLFMRSRLKLFIENAASEFCWFSIRLGSALRAGAGGQSSPANSSLPKSTRALRRMLRANPLWSKGHLELAFSELDYLSHCPRESFLSTLEAVKLSAKAVEKLLQAGYPVWLLQDSFVRLRLRYLSAQIAFFEKDYRRALSDFERLFKEPEIVQALEEGFLNSARENAAAAALAVSERALAERYIAEIPLGKRSPGASAALESLKGPRGS